MVHRMLLVKVGGRYVHLLKMFGALFTFAAAFNVLSSAYQLSTVLDVVANPYYVSAGDIFGEITGPIASLFLWLAFMILGLALYRSDRSVLPIEEDFQDCEVDKPAVKTTGARKSKK
jgi:hypothetical protein